MTALAVVVGFVVLVLMATLAPGPGTTGSLPVGSCFQDPGAAQVTDVVLVDCAEPHDYEVLGTVQLEGDAFPGDVETVVQARAACERVFREYAGVERSATPWLINALTPTAGGWSEGNRTATCLALQFDDNLEFRKVTGSLRAARSEAHEERRSDVRAFEKV